MINFTLGFISGMLILTALLWFAAGDDNDY
jgi:hypothetical protein